MLASSPGSITSFTEKNYDIIAKGLLSEVLWKSKRVQTHFKSSQFLIFANSHSPLGRE